ncbi:hypothetical protein M3205_03605 [Cytobacillus firmus]|uniref:hypothetical protein n=1 Tax=Cytobacillus firmus TaxID=1399 RepID=UPI00203C8B04|nr:hypothetical protein [Cytobacillus firmus]MCM3704803.1 hypothetical protein [Cytobacillus firmus]
MKSKGIYIFISNPYRKKVEFNVKCCKGKYAYGGENMLKSYNELTDIQQENVNYYLDQADGHRLNYLHKDFGVIRGRSNAVFRENIIHGLMMETIPFPDFLQWLSHVHLEGNNTFFVYEPIEEKCLNKIEDLDKMYTKTKEKITPLYDINKDHLNEIKLVDVKKDGQKNQLIFTIAAPAQVQVKRVESGQYELRKHVYLAYFIVDFDLRSIILLMHPTQGLASIYGEIRKREIDEVTWIILHYFTENILKFTLKEPEWIVSALAKISEEYFYHNNPIIEDKKENFSESLISELLLTLQEFDPTLKREDTLLRLERGLESLYESELIVIHKRIEKDLSFNIFLQQADRGATQFKANTRGKALGHAEAGEFIRLMWENGDIFNVGLIHIESGKEYPYIVKKTDKYYSFKKYNTSVTEKEVVDNVLRKLNEYKQNVETPTDFSGVEEIGYRTNDSQA